MLRGKTVLIGVTGGIAAYKTCELVSRLVKLGATVKVVMTENATRFVAPLTFETLSRNRVVVDQFDSDRKWEVEHVALAKEASIFVIAPATANCIAKLAAGIADDFLTTTALSVTCPILVCPAMNTRMFEASPTVENLALLAERGIHAEYGRPGRLACGDTGAGRVAEPVDILRRITELLGCKNDLEGIRALVTAGATSEEIDGARVLTNRSSGRMGACLADALVRHGATVTFVHGSGSVLPEEEVEAVCVGTTREMYDAVLSRTDRNDLFVMAAAPADYRISEPPDDKLKGDRIVLEFVKNPDIAAAVGRAIDPEKQTLVVFCAEKKDLLGRARRKRAEKHADLCVANDYSQPGAGFDVDTNIVTLLTETEEIALPEMKKSEVAESVVDYLVPLCTRKSS